MTSGGGSGPAWVDQLAFIRRSPAELEVAAADQQKRYTSDAGGDRVQFVDEDPDVGDRGAMRMKRVQA